MERFISEVVDWAVCPGGTSIIRSRAEEYGCETWAAVGRETPGRALTEAEWRVDEKWHLPVSVLGTLALLSSRTGFHPHSSKGLLKCKSNNVSPLLEALPPKVHCRLSGLTPCGPPPRLVPLLLGLLSSSDALSLHLSYPSQALRTQVRKTTAISRQEGINGWTKAPETTIRSGTMMTSSQSAPRKGSWGGALGKAACEAQARAQAVWAGLFCRGSGPAHPGADWPYVGSREWLSSSRPITHAQFSFHLCVSL